MIKVGVRVPPLTGSAGEYLADVSALEAAGADAIWLEMADLEAWVVMGALAIATKRVRLGCILEGVALRGGAFPGASIAAAQKLSRGRVVLAAPAGDLARVATREAKRFSIGEARGVPVDGVIHQLDSPTSAPRPAVTPTDEPVEVWGDIAMPADRDAWSATMSAYEAAGVTGVILRWDPRLIDLLRNAEPDDRADLLMSTG